MLPRRPPKPLLDGRTKEEKQEEGAYYGYGVPMARHCLFEV
jgi:hypothetical protein